MILPDIEVQSMMLNDKQKEIYSRQIMLKDFGEEGQNKLNKSSVLVVGCGGLGASVLYYLTAMGIGHIGLCDGDKVTLSNLNRQVLFTMDDIGKSKANTASIRLKALNPNLKTTVYDVFMDEKLAGETVPAYDIIVDCLDNFDTRFILNDASIKAKKPLIHAGVGEYFGQLMSIIPGKSPCLRCLFPGTQGDGSTVLSNTNTIEPSPCVPIIGPTPGVLGSMQAMEVVKYLLGLQVCTDGIITYNGLEQSLSHVKIEVNPNCVCAS